MNQSIHFSKYVQAELIAAEPYRLLNILVGQGIEFYDTEQRDLITVRVTVHKRHYVRMKKITEASGAVCNHIGKIGYLWKLDLLRRRPLLAAGILLFLIFAISLSERVLFVQVVGNETVPAALIMKEAKDCGITIGATRRAVRSEQIKNTLLSKIPQLQWVGVNTNGSTATIQVRERSSGDLHKETAYTVSGVVASRDGVISDLSVLKGTALCSVGQSVKKGDLLVSGYTDCGLKVVAQKAEAEIFANTLRENSFLAVLASAERQQLTNIHVCKSLRVGKKVIKLCNHSGILDTSCVKMYSEEYVHLPGNYQIPVSVITEEYRYYDSASVTVSEDVGYVWMEQQAIGYLQTQMNAGKIVKLETESVLSDFGCTLYTHCACNEMIGQVKFEEIFEKNAEDN